MKKEDRDPMFPLTILATALLLLLLVGLVLLGYGALTKGEATPPNSTPTIGKIESSSVFPLSRTPSATRTPNLKYGLNIGVIDQKPSCRFFTEVMVRLSEQYLNETIHIVSFDSAESLFDALAADDVQLTLCYTDPTHRSFLRQHVGHINVLANSYWEDGVQGLQVIIHAEYVVALPKEKPCLLDLLKSLGFSAETPNTTDVDGWIADNQDRIATWVDCQP